MCHLSSKFWHTSSHFAVIIFLFFFSFFLFHWFFLFLFLFDVNFTTKNFKSGPTWVFCVVCVCVMAYVWHVHGWGAKRQEAVENRSFGLVMFSMVSVFWLQVIAITKKTIHPHPRMLEPKKKGNAKTSSGKWRVVEWLTRRERLRHALQLFFVFCFFFHLFFFLAHRVLFVWLQHLEPWDWVSLWQSS